MRCLSLLLLILMIPGVLLAQEMFSPISNDARSRAMGQTGIMMATGSSAIFYNPGNLATVTRKTLQFSGQGSLGTIDDDDYWSDQTLEYWQGRYRLYPRLAQASFAVPYQPSGSNMKLVFGVGYNSYFDYGSNIREEFTSFDTLYVTKGELRGGLNTISPAVAFNIDNRIFVGLSYNKSVRGKVSRIYKYSLSPLPPSGVYLRKSEYEVSLSASFITVGAIAKLSSELSAGLIYRSGFKYVWDDPEYRWEYSDGLDDRAEEPKYYFRLPSLIGLAATYQLSPNILVAGEYQTRAYSAIEDENGDSFGLEDGGCYRLGLELESSIPIRLGIFSDAIMLADVGDDKPRSVTGLTSGFGLNSKNFQIDLFGEYAVWSYDYEDLGNFYEYKESHFSFGMSAAFMWE